MYFDIFALGGDRQLARKGHFNACTGGFDAQGVRINGFRLRIEYQRGIPLVGGGGFAQHVCRAKRRQGRAGVTAFGLAGVSTGAQWDDLGFHSGTARQAQGK